MQVSRQVDAPEDRDIGFCGNIQLRSFRRIRRYRHDRCDLRRATHSRGCRAREKEDPPNKEIIFLAQTQQGNAMQCNGSALQCEAGADGAVQQCSELVHCSSTVQCNAAVQYSCACHVI